ncbi:nucleotidyltransferase family protein [Roseivivax sp. CAU 1761]
MPDALPDALMVFAAGFGTRMGALTADRPKPLVEVGGRALLDRTLDLARAHRPQLRVVVNAHYRAPQIVAHLAGRDVHVSVEMPEILDTGGGLRHALPHLGRGPVFTANSDAVLAGPNPFDILAAAWRPDMEALLLTVPLPQTVGRKGGGDFTLDAAGQLSRGGDAVYTGLQILRTEGLDEIAEPVFSLNRLWDAAARRDGLYGVSYPGRWCDVGHPGGIALAESLLERA